MLYNVCLWIDVLGLTDHDQKVFLYRNVLWDARVFSVGHMVTECTLNGVFSVLRPLSCTSLLINQLNNLRMTE